MFNNKNLSNALIFSIPFLILLLIILQLSRGMFTYTLDDPYIHLTLAKNIWNGNYGININEPSAPSSSILWPFLLAPFSVLGTFFQFVPLFLNYLFLICTGLVTYKLFAAQDDRENLFICFVLLLSANLYGLAFTGMEHSLQVLLVAVIAVGVLKKQEDGRLLHSYSFGRLTIFSIVLLPLVRYEGLAISLPVIAYLWMKGERKSAALTLVPIAVLMTMFSLYLYDKGLGFLPTSVLVKSSHEGLNSTYNNLLNNLSIYWFMLIPVQILFVHYWRSDRSLSCMLVCVTILHFLFGHYGWFGRYEVYYVYFILLFTLDLFFKKKLFKIYYWIILPMQLPGLFYNTLLTPLAATNILNQQGQMAQVTKALGEPVAVNDLGMISFESGQYVYDLVGLGSKEALDARKLKQFNADWISTHMQSKHIKYAIIYDSWFPRRPANWIKVGELDLLDKLITPSDSRVSFYATDPESAKKLINVIIMYGDAHPSPHYQFQVWHQE